MTHIPRLYCDRSTLRCHSHRLQEMSRRGADVGMGSGWLLSGAEGVEGGGSALKEERVCEQGWLFDRECIRIYLFNFRI